MSEYLRMVQSPEHEVLQCTPVRQSIHSPIDLRPVRLGETSGRICFLTNLDHVLMDHCFRVSEEIALKPDAVNFATNSSANASSMRVA